MANTKDKECDVTFDSGLHKWIKCRLKENHQGGHHFIWNNKEVNS